MEKKLIVIPIIFILLRIWSLLFVIIEVESGQNKPLNCTAIKFFLVMGVSLSYQGCSYEGEKLKPAYISHLGATIFWPISRWLL